MYRESAGCQQRYRRLRRELADGIRYLAATRVLFTLLVFMLVLNLCLGADKLIIFFTRNTLHLPPGQVGLVVTAGGPAAWWARQAPAGCAAGSGRGRPSRSARRPPDSRCC